MVAITRCLAQATEEREKLKKDLAQVTEERDRLKENLEGSDCLLKAYHDVLDETIEENSVLKKHISKSYFYNELRIRRILGGTDSENFTDHQRINMSACNQSYEENGILDKCEKFDIGTWKGNVYVCFNLKSGMTINEDRYGYLRNDLQYNWGEYDEVYLQRMEKGKWNFKYTPFKGEYRYILHFSGEGTIDILTKLDVLLNGKMFNQ